MDGPVPSYLDAIGDGVQELIEDGIMVRTTNMIGEHALRQRTVD